MKPYYDDGKGTVIYHGDCREVLPLKVLAGCEMRNQFSLNNYTNAIVAQQGTE